MADDLEMKTIYQPHLLVSVNDDHASYWQVVIAAGVTVKLLPERGYYLYAQVCGIPFLGRLSRPSYYSPSPTFSFHHDQSNEARKCYLVRRTFD